MLNIEKWKINRIVFHTIHAKVAGGKGKDKTEPIPAFAEYAESVFPLDTIAISTIRSRIVTAFSKENKQFKLEIARSDDNSYFYQVHDAQSISDDDFLERSKIVADYLVTAQSKATAPSGVLALMDGTTDKGKYFVLCIKAEIHEALRIGIKSIDVIPNIFLGTDKKTYKIGLIFEATNDTERQPNDKYSCYMFDDMFELKRYDLTEYFYKGFLGFTTSKNDKILTKRWFALTEKFFTDNVSNMSDRMGSIKCVVSYLRENVKGIVEPYEFGRLNIESTLFNKYEKMLADNDFPTAFTKNLSAIDKSKGLLKAKEPLMYSLTLEGPLDSMNDNLILLNGTEESKNKMRQIIDSGKMEQVVIIGHDIKRDTKTIV